MAVYTEANRQTEFLLMEEDGTISRDIVLLAANTGPLKSGTVLGRVTATGEYKPYDDANTDGSETALGILLLDAEASALPQAVTIIARLAEVKRDSLIFVTGADRLASLLDLASHHIIAR